MATAANNERSSRAVRAMRASRRTLLNAVVLSLVAHVGLAIWCSQYVVASAIRAQTSIICLTLRPARVVEPEPLPAEPEPVEVEPAQIPPVTSEPTPLVAVLAPPSEPLPAPSEIVPALDEAPLPIESFVASAAAVEAEAKEPPGVPAPAAETLIGGAPSSDSPTAGGSGSALANAPSIGVGGSAAASGVGTSSGLGVGSAAPGNAPASVSGPAGANTPGGAAKPDYLHNPRPEYPRVARVHHWQGTTRVRVQVLATGRVGKVELIESSGHDVLDQAALTAVRAWLFVPARKDDKAVESNVEVPVMWKLVK